MNAQPGPLGRVFILDYSLGVIVFALLNPRRTTSRLPIKRRCRPPLSSIGPRRRARLVRLGEIVLGAVVVVVYLVVYWQDTLMFLRNFAKSLRYGL